ncbi:MAG: TolC family protein [Bacteroidales bacterium]|nr:TolC family protein [Bacteroidales bacterium]
MKKIILAGIAALASCIAGFAQNTYTLEQLLDSAKVNNIKVRSAGYDLKSAAQQRKEAFTNFFPKVSATGAWFNANKSMMQAEINLGEQISPEMGAALAQILPPEALMAMGNPISINMMKNGTIGSVMAMQPVFAGGQIVNGNKLAKVGEEAGELQLRMASDEVAKTTEGYFWQLVSLEEKAKTVEAVETLLSDINKDVTVAVKAGVAVRNDLLQVQLRQSDVAAQKLKLQNGISLLKLLLCQYCGLADDDFSVSYDINADAPLVSREDFSEALKGTNEYKLLGKQVEAAELQKKMEIGKNLPTVAVGAGYNYHNLMDKDQNFGMVFATVSVPISDWWGGSHAIKRKSIAVQKAKEELEDSSRLLEIRMQSAWNGVEEAAAQLSLARQSIEQAQENLRLNQDFYKAGTCTMSDLLEAQLLYQQTMDRVTEAYATYRTAITDYRLALGR